MEHCCVKQRFLFTTKHTKNSKKMHLVYSVSLSLKNVRFDAFLCHQDCDCALYVAFQGDVLVSRQRLEGNNDFALPL